MFMLNHNFRCFYYLAIRFFYVSKTVKLPLNFWLHSEVDSSPVFTLSENIDIHWEKVPFSKTDIGKYK